MAKVTISLDGETKEQAQQIFAELGLSLSSAVEMFLRAVVREDGIPFRVTRKPQAESIEYAVVRMPAEEGADQADDE